LKLKTLFKNRNEKLELLNSFQKLIFSAKCRPRPPGPPCYATDCVVRQKRF